MLKTNGTRFGWLLLIVMFITSCKQSELKQAKYIPKDASAVFSLNPKHIQEKLQSSNISLDSILQSAFSEDTSMMPTSEELAASGIDLTKDIYLFVNNAGSIMAGTTVTTGMVAALDKPESLEAFIKKKAPSAQIKKADDYSYAELSNGFAVGWNDDVVLVDNVTGYNAQTGESSSGSGAAQTQLAALFTLKADASLASLTKFRDASSSKADMLFWSNSNGTLASVPMLSISKASDLFKDTYTSGIINFENGKVVMDVKIYPNEIMSDTLQEYAGPNVNMDLLKKYPGAVNGYALFSFNPTLLLSLLDYAGMTPTVDQMLQNQGYSLSDVTKAFKGDFAVIFSGLNGGINDSSKAEHKELSGNLLIDAAIGNKASYDKIVSQLAKKGLMVEQNGDYVPAIFTKDSGGFVMKTDAKNVVFSSDSMLLQQYMSGSGNATVPDDIITQTKGSSVAFYVDIASILNTFPADSSAETITSARQTFKNLIATTENYNEGVIKGHTELRTQNANENSLATLSRYFGSVGKAMRRIRGTAGIGAFHHPDSQNNDSDDEAEY